jgi:PAS domain S-box-containing protein
VGRTRADATRDRLWRTLDSLPDAVFALDENGRCTHANRAAERLADLPREALIGTTIWEHVPGEAGGSVRQAFWSAVTDQIATTLHSTRGDEWLAVRVTPCSGGAVVSMADVSVPATRPVPILADIRAVLDRGTDPNRALATVARRSVPELGDWCVVDLVDEHGWLHATATAHVDPRKERVLRELDHTQAWSRRRIPRAVRDGRPVLVPVAAERELRAIGMPLRQVRALQQMGLSSLLLVPLRVHNHTFGLLTFGAANAHRRLDEPDLAVAEELGHRCAAAIEYAQLYRTARESAQAREEFVAATSHELRTPLSHIKGFVSTLRTTDTVWDPDTRDDFLAEIEREADRLAKLVENLLDMSRIESSGVDRTALSETAPQALIEGGIDRVRVSLGNHALEIDVPAELPTVRVEPSQIERVIANLLENAAKYSPPDAPIGVIGRSDGTAVTMRVEDRGLGIPPEHVERIFEPFFREPASGYPAMPGTGLGLAICRSIVRAHEGQIWVEQRPGGGAVLAFTLPVATNGRRV